ncbi:MoaD/ThiS family protein [Pinisolibacter aquiterrae]|uniref:MoaD/ThiS family protein n=1 Tax=Pinisolibacter aquiterrae TaxID=2815579 RepID=UPI001C3D5A0E|nr:hypothetical protein [Pinisolibacter aquiterrae]MBV5262751.1 MoaD/ThiS family protein [Pinisolibacter aquiterrae]MCC8233571.1 hypothetical protein [Pinisolibacter aquiterrae]
MNRSANEPAEAPGIGHNADGATIAVEVRLFNSLTRHAGRDGPVRRLTLPAGATVGDVIDRLRLPPADIFLVLRNGRDVSPGLYGGGRANREAGLESGDVLAFSGPVPYSYGLGAPVV